MTWNTEVARSIARREQLELTEQRWEIVRFVRDYFEQHHSVPEARVLLKGLAKCHGKEQATR